MMKRKIITLILSIVLAVFSSITGFTQAPQALTYQGEARDQNGRIIKNETIELIFSIYNNNYSWDKKYEITTDQYGMFTVILADPADNGVFTLIPWENPPVYLNVTLEYKGEEIPLGETEFLSVPYALSAGSADYNDLLNKPVLFDGTWSSLTGTPTTISGYGITDAFDGSWESLTGKPTTASDAGLTDAVTTTGDHVLDGNITFTNDILVNGLTVGKGQSNNVFNTALGFQALYSTDENSVSGTGNTAIGYHTLQLNIVGNSNTALGTKALRYNDGSYNTAIGSGALNLNSSGNWNTATGTGALYYNSTGLSNTANGESAIYNNETGNFNTAIGNNALYSNKDGHRNTAVGSMALNSNISGHGNTAIGVDAGRLNTGSGSVFLGFEAGLHETGSNRLFIDNQSRGNETNGRIKSLVYGVFDSDPAKQTLTINGRVGIGTIAPTSTLDVVGDINFSGELRHKGIPINMSDAVLTTGDQTIDGVKTFNNDIFVNGLTIGMGSNTHPANTAIGFQALSSDGVGIDNTALGFSTLHSNSEGNTNTAIGSNALYYNTIGSGNTATGTAALWSNTEGNYNTANGRQALVSNKTGQANTAVGMQTLYNTINGNYNVGVGSNALYSNIGGQYNTAIGTGAGYNNNGTGNVFLGNSAGRYETGNNKLFIDNNPRGNEANARTKSLIYGVFDQNPDSQVLTINGKVGIGTTSPSSNLTVDGGVQVSDDNDVPTAKKAGTMRYREDSNNSYFEVCMKRGPGYYEWVPIVQYNW